MHLSTLLHFYNCCSSQLQTWRRGLVAINLTQTQGKYKSVLGLMLAKEICPATASDYVAHALMLTTSSQWLIRNVLLKGKEPVCRFSFWLIPMKIWVSKQHCWCKWALLWPTPLRWAISHMSRLGFGHFMFSLSLKVTCVDQSPEANHNTAHNCPKQSRTRKKLL